jgi:hypothetical protein
MTDLWYELANAIRLCDNGGVLYTSAAFKLMAAHGIDGDRLHAATEDNLAPAQYGEERIDWDAVARDYGEPL